MRHTSTDKATPAPHTYLFTVRLWLEDLGGDRRSGAVKCRMWLAVRCATFAIGRR
jgi:hypothetical protein